MPLYDEDFTGQLFPEDGNSFSEINEANFFETQCMLPKTALCLKVPNASEDELVVHRENGQDFVFLFESLDDAYDYAIEASEALDFAPQVGRVQLSDLHFSNARFKPALSEQIDLVLRTR